MLFYIRIKNLLIYIHLKEFKSLNEDLVNCQLIDLFGGDINNTIVFLFSINNFFPEGILIELDS